jgi:glycosyltransferase involved in cell wall biosynthesis
MTQSRTVRIGILQRVLPAYRANLFDLLAETFDGRVSVFAGEGRRQEMIAASIPSQAEYHPAQNRHLFSGRFYACWQGGLLNWLADFDPDVLIMEANPRYLHSPAAIRWMHAHGKKVIGWGLGAPASDQSLLGLRTWLRKRFVRQFDALITYSTQGAKEYAALGFAPQRIHVAPNAAAPKPVHPLPLRSENFRGGKPILVFVGRLQERKRVDMLIKACAALPSEFQPMLWVIGDGPSRAALETFAAETYPGTIFHGAQHGKELAQRLQAADLFVLPGTGGLAVQQAMAYGLPVIVGEADGTQADLVRPENGWLLHEPTPEQLSNLIMEALQDVKMLRKKGEESYRIVSEEINLNAMAAVFLRAIAEVLNG